MQGKTCSSAMRYGLGLLVQENSPRQWWFTANQCKIILTDHSLSHSETHPDKSGLFQDDNVLIYTAWWLTEWFDEDENEHIEHSTMGGVLYVKHFLPPLIKTERTSSGRMVFISLQRLIELRGSWWSNTLPTIHTGSFTLSPVYISAPLGPC